MKFLLASLIIFLSMASSAQKADSLPKPSAPVYRVVEVMPEYPGGTDSLTAFFKANLKYPRSARENSISGKVVYEAVVETDGSLSEIKIKTAVSPKLDEEALRLIKLLPKFSPGKQKGKLVRVMITLPVDFKLPKL